MLRATLIIISTLGILAACTRQNIELTEDIPPDCIAAYRNPDIDPVRSKFPQPGKYVSREMATNTVLPTDREISAIDAYKTAFSICHSKMADMDNLPPKAIALNNTFELGRVFLISQLSERHLTYADYFGWDQRLLKERIAYLQMKRDPSYAKLLEQLYKEIELGNSGDLAVRQPHVDDRPIFCSRDGIFERCRP